MPEPTTRRQYPTQPASVAQARTLVREFLREWGITDAAGEDTENAILVTSELATNAVTHACTRSHFWLALELFGDVLHIAVRDYETEAPAKKNAAQGDVHGRGLFLVDSLSCDWGWCVETTGKTVWAELRVKVPACSG
ncbi:ATP-binding protein [Streptomyces sp. NPDC048297]|uniref:ATP-binding protein n=1 Tax=Streptomyces sp. NPDC048297 TaxID=3365531 RepID=UPI00371E74F9